MTYLRAIELLTWLDVLGMCLILVRLAQHGLTKRFKFFVLVLALDLVGLMIILTAGIRSLVFCQFWERSQLVQLILVPMCFYEMFQDLYLKHPGLAVYSRSVMFRTLVVGATAACVSLPFSQRNFVCQWGYDCWIYQLVGLKVFIVLGVTLFTPAMIIYLKSLDGVHLDRNTSVYAVAFTSHIFLGCVGSLLLIFLNSRDVMEICNVVFLVLNLGCQAIWILGLTPYQAETRTVDPTEERAVFEQLRRMRAVVDEMEEKTRVFLGRR